MQVPCICGFAHVHAFAWERHVSIKHSCVVSLRFRTLALWCMTVPCMLAKLALWWLVKLALWCMTVPCMLAKCMRSYSMNTSPRWTRHASCCAAHAVEWMQLGLHIVTPNKKFGAGPLPRYLELKELAQKTRRRFMGEVRHRTCRTLPPSVPMLLAPRTGWTCT